MKDGGENYIISVMIKTGHLHKGFCAWSQVFQGIYRFHYNARWVCQLSNFGDKGQGRRSQVQLRKGLKSIASLHLRTLIQMDSTRSYLFSRAIARKQAQIEHFLLQRQIRQVLIFPKGHYEPQKPRSYLFLLSSAVSGCPRTSFLFLGEPFYILRGSRTLTHFTTLLNRKYFWYFHHRKHKLWHAVSSFMGLSW